MDQGWLDLLFAHARGIPRARVFPYLWEQAWIMDEAFRREKLPIRPAPPRWAGQLLKGLHHLVTYAYSFDEPWGRLLDLIYETPEVPLDYVAIDYYDPSSPTPSAGPIGGTSSSARTTPLPGTAPSRTGSWRGSRTSGGTGASCPRASPSSSATWSGSTSPSSSPRTAWPPRSVAGRNHGRRDNLLRSEYLRQHVGVVKKLRGEGWPLIGYLHWSLVDNYEWGSYAPRFGLYSIDREAVDYRGDNPSRTYAQEIASARRNGGANPS